jgi:hypothetical protein
VNDLIPYAFRGVGALLYAFPMLLAARKSDMQTPWPPLREWPDLLTDDYARSVGFACAKELGDAIGVET